jgi:transposase
METLPLLPGAAAACSAPPLPTAPCPVCPRLAAEFEPWRQAAYWQAMHHRAVQREHQLRREIDTLQAEIRSLKQRLFGRTTERAAALPEFAAPVPSPPPTPPRPRGQQPGRPGPQRRTYDYLPAVEETIALPADQQHCPDCGRPFAPFPGTDDSTVLEIAVRAYRRVLRRQRYRPTCRCGCNPGVVTAPPPPKVLPKSLLGVSVWVTVLLDKYLFYRPTYRLLADLASHGLDLSLGTITDGLQRLLPLLGPLYDALVEHSRRQTLWHADETRWLVFATVEGKVGYRWYLWVFHAAEVVVFVLASGRAHDVPEAHLGPVEEGILVVDRYAAYKALAQVKDGRITLAFCWAHVRRDFVEAARDWPLLQSWGLDWVQRIGAVYHANDARLAVRDQPAAFALADQALRQQVTALEQQAAAELREDPLHPARRKTLKSLHAHWQGLTVFVAHPEVPMDNNTAERSERGPVVGRKNYYGSGAVWSGQLAAWLFSLFQTLALWHLDPRRWLTAYLQACAVAGGKAPDDVAAYLPWNLSEEQQQAWRGKPAAPNTS